MKDEIMRLWSLHPKYLDRQGLIALWREGLLAQAVLAGKTKGYRSHPQLIRFREHPNPLEAIAEYLSAIHAEARSRGYSFDKTKIHPHKAKSRIKLIPVTQGQLNYERSHLIKKLKTRTNPSTPPTKIPKSPDPHPIFKITEGPIEPWEHPK